MNIEEAKAAIKILQAFVAGKPIECAQRFVPISRKHWGPLPPNPNFNFGMCEYRVKTQLLEAWWVWDNDKQKCLQIHNHENPAKSVCKALNLDTVDHTEDRYRVVHMKENV